MKIRSGQFNPLKNFSGDVWTIWGDFFSDLFLTANKCSYNWHTLDIIHIEIDWEKYLGSISFTLVLLGFGCRLNYQYVDLKTTAGGKSLLKALEDTQEGRVKTIPLEELNDTDEIDKTDKTD